MKTLKAENTVRFMRLIILLVFTSFLITTLYGDSLSFSGRIKVFINNISYTEKFNDMAEPVPMELFNIENIQVPDRSIFEFLGKKLAADNPNYIPYKTAETSDKLFRRAYYKIAGTESEVVFVLNYEDVGYGYVYDIFLIEYRTEKKTIYMDFDRYKVNSFNLNKIIGEYEDYEYIKADDIINNLKPGADETDFGIKAKVIIPGSAADIIRLPSLRDRTLITDNEKIYYLLFEELSEDRSYFKSLWRYYINDGGNITRYGIKYAIYKYGVFIKESTGRTKECASGNIALGTNRNSGYLKNIFLLTEHFGSPDIINKYDGFSLAYYILPDENALAIIYFTPDYMHSICLIKKPGLYKNGRYSYAKLTDRKMIPVIEKNTLEEEDSLKSTEFKDFVKIYGIPYGYGFLNCPSYKYPYNDDFIFVSTDNKDKITLTFPID